MYVNRDFEGEKSKPWEGGQFGFVRGPVRNGDRILCIQFHEGIDIRPVHRDAQGNPTDEVRAAAAGTVVHVSREAGASNYGRYVVVEHHWDGCPFYTIYAHLASISVESGQSLRQGEPLGIMGFTGAGIDRERAHIHFEVCMMLSRNFEGWHDANFPKGSKPPWHLQWSQSRGRRSRGPLARRPQKSRLENFGLLRWRRTSIQDHGKEFDELLPHPRLSLARAQGRNRKSAGMDDHVFALRRSNQNRGRKNIRHRAHRRVGQGNRSSLTPESRKKWSAGPGGLRTSRRPACVLQSCSPGPTKSKCSEDYSE